MSWEASVWALKHAPVDDCQAVMVLMALADFAHPDGTAAWPGQAKIAEYARCSVRTVQRHLTALEAAGVIRRGDQTLLDRVPAYRRPVVWDLAMEIRKEARQDDVSLPDRGVTGDGGEASPVTGHPTTLVSYKPPVVNPLEIPPGKKRSRPVDPLLASLRTEKPNPARRCSHGEPMHRHPDCFGLAS